MNKIYRVIWNSALRCFMVTSELAKGKVKSSGGVAKTVLGLSGLVLAANSYAANPQIAVNNTTESYDNYPVATALAAQHALLAEGSSANLTFNNSFATASAANANAARIQDGATLNATGTSLATLAASNITLNILNGSAVNLQDSSVAALGKGSTGIFASGNSLLTANNLRVGSEGPGIRLDNANLNASGLTVTVNGSNANGIYASNNSISTLADADVTSSGTGAMGIYADSGSSISGNNVTVSTSGASARGVISNGEGTRVTLDGGSINTSGRTAHAAYAGHNGTLQISNMDITTTAGSQAGAGGSAALMIDTGGHIVADNLTLSSASNVIWMRAGTLDANNLNISQSSGGNGPAIWAFSGSVLNLNNSNIELTLPEAQGIYTDAGLANLDGVKIYGENGGTALSVRYDGRQNAKNVDISINNADGQNASGLWMSFGSGKTQATIENSRIVVNGSAASGITANSAGQNASLINTLISSDNIAVSVNNAAGLQLNMSGSTLTAPVLLKAGEVNDTGVKTNNIYLDASDASRLSGDIALERDYVSDSRLSLDTGSVWQGTSSGLNTLNLSNNSQWNMTGDSNVVDLNLNDSTVVFNHDTDSFKTLTVEGDYTSNGGTLVMNSILANDGSAHDSLVVSGNTSGETNVVINKAGGTGAKTLNGIEVITVGGESDGEFTQQGRIVAGAYDYHLTRGTDGAAKNWYLTSEANPVDPVVPTDPTDPTDPVNPIDPVDPTTPVDPVIRPVEPVKMISRPEAGSYIANMAAASTLFNLRLHDRGGETQYTDAITGEQKVTSLWMRNTGGHNTSKDSSGQLDTQTNRYVLQLGGDLGKWSFDGTDSLHVGALAGYGNAQSTTDSNVTGYRSKGQVNGYSLGVYGTWYQNAEAQTGAYVDSWAQYSWFNNSVKGDGLPQESYKSKGVSASLEGGYSWKLGEDAKKNSYFIEPNAQVIWSNIQADSLTESNGTRVSMQGNGDVQSRVGVRASMKTPGENQQPVFQPYLEANWINNSQNAASTLNGVSIEQRGSKNIAEVRAGVDGKITERVNLWGNVGQQMGSENYRDTSAMLGLKVSF